MRNALFCENRNDASADRHIPAYAKALMDRYAEEMNQLRGEASSRRAAVPGSEVDGNVRLPGTLFENFAAWWKRVIS